MTNDTVQANSGEPSIDHSNGQGTTRASLYMSDVYLHAFTFAECGAGNRLFHHQHWQNHGIDKGGKGWRYPVGRALFIVASTKLARLNEASAHSDRLCTLDIVHGIIANHDAVCGIHFSDRY